MRRLFVGRSDIAPGSSAQLLKLLALLAQKFCQLVHPLGQSPDLRILLGYVPLEEIKFLAGLKHFVGFRHPHRENSAADRHKRETRQRA